MLERIMSHVSPKVQGVAEGRCQTQKSERTMTNAARAYRRFVQMLVTKLTEVAERRGLKLPRTMTVRNDDSRIYETLKPVASPRRAFSSRCRSLYSSEEELENDRNERILAELAVKRYVDELEQDNMNNEVIQQRLALASSAVVYDVPRPISTVSAVSSSRKSLNFMGSIDETDYLCRVGKTASRGLRPRPQEEPMPIYYV